MTENVEKRINKKIIKHAANSGAILDLPDLKLDMVREGIILYGLYPSTEVEKNLNLKPCMSIKTNVSFVKTVPDGTSIGYGRTYFTTKETVVATIPVGYADGYSRTMSNKAFVIIKGKKAPVIGNVCMDQFMVDISDIDDVKAGDTVILIGQDGDISITADDIAEIQGTISYEVLCNVGKRVPRVYIRNGESLKTINYIR